MSGLFFIPGHDILVIESLENFLELFSIPRLARLVESVLAVQLVMRLKRMLANPFFIKFTAVPVIPYDFHGFRFHLEKIKYTSLSNLVYSNVWKDTLIEVGMESDRNSCWSIRREWAVWSKHSLQRQLSRSQIEGKFRLPAPSKSKVRTLLSDDVSAPRSGF